MPTPAGQWRKEARQPLHPPKKYHHAPSIPKRRAPSNTFKKECDDATVVARTSSRVSPGTRGVVGKGYTQRPFGGTDAASRRHRVGAGQADKDFSRSTTTTITPGTSRCTTPTAAHQPVPPRLPDNPAASLELPTWGLAQARRPRPRERAQLGRGEGTTSTAAAEPTGRGDEDLPGLDGPAGSTWTRTILSPRCSSPTDEILTTRDRRHHAITRKWRRGTSSHWPTQTQMGPNRA